MKKILFAAFFAVSVAAACTTSVVIEPEDPVNEGRTVTLTAALPDTKVAVNTSTGKVTWTAGDAIAIFNTEGTKFRFNLESGEGTNLATFKCTTFTGTLGSKAVYPYDWAGDTEGTITVPEYIPWDEDFVPAVMASAVSEISGENEVSPLYFRSLMAIMEFTLQDVPAYACALKLWSAAGVPLNGTWTVNSACNGLESRATGNTQQVIYFPYKTAYGAEATATIRAAVPAYAYKDLKIRVLDGDEDVISGTGKSVPTSVTSQMGDNLSAYVKMSTLNIRTLVGSSRDNYVKVNNVKWAKGNLLCKEGTTTEGFQDNWSITSSQEEYYSSVSATCFDHFNWGGIGRASRFSSAGYMQPSTPGLTIEEKIYSDAGGTTLVEGEDRFANSGLNTNTPLYGDLAFWASKGTYRLPTPSEIATLYITAAGQKPVNVQFGSYKGVNGVLFTTSFRGEVFSTFSTSAKEFDAADIESGLFLPKAGRRFIGYWQQSGEVYTWKWNSSSMNITAEQAIGNKSATALTTTNTWGVYWSSKYSAQNHSVSGNEEGFYDNTATILWLKSSAIGYGYTQNHANSNCNINGSFDGPKQSGMQVSMGATIRPVLK